MTGRRDQGTEKKKAAIAALHKKSYHFVIVIAKGRYAPIFR